MQAKLMNEGAQSPNPTNDSSPKQKKVAPVDMVFVEEEKQTEPVKQ